MGKDLRMFGRTVGLDSVYPLHQPSIARANGFVACHACLRLLTLCFCVFCEFQVSKLRCKRATYAK